MLGPLGGQPISDEDDEKTAQAIQTPLDVARLPKVLPKVLLKLVVDYMTGCCGCRDRLGLSIISHSDPCKECKTLGVLHSKEECSVACNKHCDRYWCEAHEGNVSDHDSGGEFQVEIGRASCRERV